MDARVMGNFFSYAGGHFDVDGFNAYPNLHLASIEALADVYPWASVWRLSAGLMLYNGNQFSGTAIIAGGSSFSIDGKNFYSSTTDPVMGFGLLNLHSRQPAVIVSGGFGKFIPRSERHWSFPSEFGVIFTGAPIASLTMSGTVCTNAKQTQCSSLSDSSNPITV